MVVLGGNASDGGGATAMMPMNGASGTSTLPENSATLRSRSSLMILGVTSPSRSGNTPHPGPVELTPYGTRV